MQNRIDCLFLPPVKLAAKLDKWLSAKIVFVTLSTAPTSNGDTCRVNTRAKKVGCFLHNISLADFLETILRKFGAIWVKRAERRFFFYPDNWTRKSHQQRGKKKEKKKEPGRKEWKRKKQWCTLSFYNGYFGDSFGRKKLPDGRGLFGGNVFKNPARALLYQIIISQSRPKYPWRKKWSYCVANLIFAQI